MPCMSDWWKKFLKSAASDLNRSSAQSDPSEGAMVDGVGEGGEAKNIIREIGELLEGDRGEGEVHGGGEVIITSDSDWSGVRVQRHSKVYGRSCSEGEMEERCEWKVSEKHKRDFKRGRVDQDLDLLGHPKPPKKA